MVLLDAYEEWRELERTHPEQARERVQQANAQIPADKERRPLLEVSEKCAPVRTPRCEQIRLQGVLVWRTLETVIDRERVDRARRIYHQRFAGKAASLEGFRAACEEVSERSLRWFFDYYLRGSALPAITLRRLPGHAPNEFAAAIVVRNVPPEYQVRVEMRMHTASGSFTHSVATSGEITPFTVTSQEPVTRIVLDPDARILRVTEAARRHQTQIALPARAGGLEAEEQFTEAAAVYHCGRYALRG